jgi:hypothetical protein
MKPFLVALVIGLITIGISVRFLAGPDSTYEADIFPEKVIAIGETFEAANYDITPTAFNCGDYTTKQKVVFGCVLSVKLKNTTDFSLALNLDGDKVIDSQQLSYDSSQDRSAQFVENNQLLDDIEPGAEVEGGIWFDVPANVTITTAHIFEYANQEPIIIQI